MSSKILPLNITQRQDKKCFPLRIFSVNVQNVTKFAENCGFGYIPRAKLQFLFMIHIQQRNSNQAHPTPDIEVKPEKKFRHFLNSKI